MATQVLIAHTGQRLLLDVSQHSSLDAFKGAVSRQTSIPTQAMIILTSQGTKAKFQTIQNDSEVYVYDSRLTQATSPSTPQMLAPAIPLPKIIDIASPPSSIADTRSLESWQSLFKARRAWALDILEDCSRMAATAQERYGEMDVMMRCLDAAVANLESHVRTLEPKYQELKTWFEGAQTEYTTLANGWERYLALARKIPIPAEMVQYMTRRDAASSKSRPLRETTLEDLLDPDTTRKAGRLGPAALKKFNSRILDLDKAATRLFQEASGLFGHFERTLARSAMSHEADSAHLLQDLEALAKKIDTDYQTVMEYYNSQKDVPQASKIAATHTERLLPSLKKRALEMDDMLRYATQARNDLATESVELMKNITDVTTLSSSVKSQMTVINHDDELATFDYLRLIQQVPYMYASFVAEAVRRHEWYEKVKSDSSTLLNEMALFQQEENKRRKKWHKSVGSAYGPDPPLGEEHVPGIEVNLLGEERHWPSLAKKDLEEFNELLVRHQADPDIVADVAKLIADLNNPTKQQSKRLKAFKNGSVHEAALGRSGLLIRGDDDVLRSLQDDKTKLESKLRTAESRVRRLEDLLHRQSQAVRPSLGSLFQPPSQQLSERNDSTISARSPQSSEDRRNSSEATETLNQRIQQLEGELTAEKQRSAIFEKNLNTRTTQHNDIKGLMDEANSTKRDLLENMEALKREFTQERKSLEEEIKRLQARLEDTEDEIDHFGESRENEKAAYDEKVRSLEAELETMSRQKQDEALKTEGQLEFLRKETRTQRERIESMQGQLQTAQDESTTSRKLLDVSEEARKITLSALGRLFEQVAPTSGIPDDVDELIEGLTSHVAEIVSKAQDARRSLAVLQSDVELAQGTIQGLRAEVAAAAERLSAEEVASLHLRENLAGEKAKVAALEAELIDSRKQLSELRGQIADGETGSESLRKRLEDEEGKTTSLTEQLAMRQSQVGSLEEEMRLFEERLNESQSKLATLTRRLEARTERAKDLTQRLYAQNDRLCQLLDRLGFSITRQGDSMLIQKLSRSERPSQSVNDLGSGDPSMSLRRSGTLQSRAPPDSSELELLHWMMQEDEDIETEKYAAYISALGSFDTDAYTDAVYRRVKDVEHMARKLQRDARAYRDKAHAVQREAHDKIAFKHFKEGDLALFLPTRNQTTGAWAAFNVGFPHYFLREQEAHRLQSREWLVARISRIQERIVDLSKGLQQQSTAKTGNATAPAPETDSVYDEENDNPFDLSDGLRWYLIDAHEDKPGAPSTPGLGKSTVAATTVEAMADMHTHVRSGSKGGGILAGRNSNHGGIEGVSKTLSKSLESRRSSTGSRKALPFAIGIGARGRDSALASETNSLRAAPPDTPPIGTSPTQANAASASGAQRQLQEQQEPQPSRTPEHKPAESSTPNGGDHRPQTPQARPPLLVQREASGASVESPSKKSVVWDSLWSLDLSYESGRKTK